MSAVFSASLVVTLVVEAFTFIGGVLAARLLLPDGRGQLAAIVLWQMVVLNLGSAGIEDALAYFGAKGDESRRTIFGRALIAFVLLATVLSAASAAVVAVVFGDGGAAVSGVWLGILIVPAWLASAITLALLRGFHLFAAWNTLRALNSLGYVAAILAFLVAGVATVGSFVAALVVSHIVVTGAGLAALAREGALAWPRPVEFPRDVFAYGLRAHTSHVGRFMTTRLDEIVISLMMAPAALGFYVVALTLAKITRPLVQTIADVALPRTAMAGPTPQGLEMFRRYVRLTGVMMVALCVPLMLVGPWLVEVIFGAAFQEAKTVVVPVVLATLPFAGKTMLASGLKAFDRGVDAGKCELAGTVAMAASAPLAALTYGIVGVAWAAVASQTLSFLMMSRALNRLFPARLTDLYIPQARDWAFLMSRATALAATVVRTASR